MTPEDSLDALYAIHSRLGAIEGKVNLVARAERGQLLEVVEAAIRKDVLVGQIYLLLDGTRTQQDLLAKLEAFNIHATRSTISRRIAYLEQELGIADVVSVTNSTVHRQDPAMDKILNLASNVKKWLRAEGATVPNGSPGWD